MNAENEFEYDFSIPGEWIEDLIMVINAGVATVQAHFPKAADRGQLFAAEIKGVGDGR